MNVPVSGLGLGVGILAGIAIGVPATHVIEERGDVERLSSGMLAVGLGVAGLAAAGTSLLLAKGKPAPAALAGIGWGGAGLTIGGLGATTTNPGS